MRNQIKIMVDGGKITKIPPTIDDPTALDKVELAIKSSTISKKVTLDFGDRLKPSL